MNANRNNHGDKQKYAEYRQRILLIVNDGDSLRRLGDNFGDRRQLLGAQ